ncbi:hypothetical protein [Methylovirgula sp. 4M-Z18]|uniref:hypothetical protein n=1 Tax=Methylovirgula sp. 4M-Z18 TaxID=2293567 RepID=UPI000E2E8729|nr:hypothetical protein [Methylovirgula sp. 4M-Z18]RFB80978.1 hypothetical protein DYH55_05785 [Methylovirgula sp. 4M-Z18]
MRNLARLSLFCVLAGLAGCSHPPEKYEPDAPANVLNGPARAVGWLPDPVQPKDFVVAGRPSEVQYMPVGIKPPDHPVKPLKGDQVKQLEQSLDAARAAQEKAQGIDPNPPPAKKGPKKPQPDVPPQTPATGQ